MRRLMRRCCSLDWGPVSLLKLMILLVDCIRYRRAHQSSVWLFYLLCVRRLGLVLPCWHAESLCSCWYAEKTLQWCTHAHRLVVFLLSHTHTLRPSLSSESCCIVSLGLGWYIVRPVTLYEGLRDLWHCVVHHEDERHQCRCLSSLLCFIFNVSRLQPSFIGLHLRAKSVW